MEGAKRHIEIKQIFFFVATDVFYWHLVFPLCVNLRIREAKIEDFHPTLRAKNTPGGNRLPGYEVCLEISSHN